MRQTENYNLNIVEGSDKYNHLTIDNPNYELIDAQMKENEVHGIQVATELKTGNVHALTRQKPDASVFRFTATSNYESGDTFTVDNTQVTALLSTGGTLGTGAYVIGSEVLCILIGTRMTMLVQSGAIAEAEDSQRLGGELPQYYATAVQNEVAMSTATAAGTLAEQNRQNLVEVNGKLLGHRTLLWENPNPNVAFNSDIELSSSDYDELEVVYRVYNQDIVDKLISKFEKGSRILLFYCSTNTNSAPIIRNRVMNYVSDTLYTNVANATTRQLTNANASTIDYNSLIPMEIYGVKYFN